MITAAALAALEPQPAPRNKSSRMALHAPGLSTMGPRSKRWDQLRRMVKQLARGMRKYPVTPTSGTHANTERDAMVAETHEAGASMLHKDFWLEALDKQHRYGFHLRAFHRVWKEDMARVSDAAESAATQAEHRKKNASFFYWLDHGDGKRLELPECSQHALRSMHVQYCDAQARKPFEVQFVASEQQHESATEQVVLAEYAATHQLVHTDELSKWIFVIDLDHKMYLGRKRKGIFHHSSFVSGAPIFAAGKIMIKHGKIIAIEPHSGHFKPTLKNLTALCQMLRDQRVNLDHIAFIKPKKWSCPWPFPALPQHLLGCELEDLASDTDYCSYKSDSDDLDLEIECRA